ncbi:MAG TPA: aminoglycoside phosphotransferase, partial [Mycobacterium sp.]|nr:aminoglycoside phosphotransferase [Mycobacterium sp.]
MVSASTTVPGGIDDLDAPWLTAALRTDAGMGTALVTSVRAEQIALDSGFSSLLYRLHLTGQHVPLTLIAKLPAQSEARGAMDLLGGYRRELAFYREVADHAPMDTPAVYTARIADNGVDFVLLLEDLADWDNADHLAGLSMERARTCLAQLAALHGWSCGTSAVALESFPSISTPIARDLLLPGFGPGWEIFRAHTETSVPPAIARFADRFAERAG